MPNGGVTVQVLLNGRKILVGRKGALFRRCVAQKVAVGTKIVFAADQEALENEEARLVKG